MIGPVAGPGFGAEVASFAAEVRAFLEAEMAGAAADPADLTGLSEDFERDLLRRAGERGWLGLAVRAEDGGSGRTPAHRAAFDVVAAELDAPLIDTAMTLAGVAVLQFADAAQRERFLPGMLGGEITMCVAYSEEHAGGNLRAIATAAVPDGAGYRLTGRKTLVTGAHKADWCLTLARTGEGRAMTMFLVDMAAAGVSVRRRPTMNGWTLDEIDFADVRVGPDAVLGARDGGWGQVVAAVAAEHSGMFYVGFARHVLDLLAGYVRGTPKAADPLVRDTLAGLEIDFAAALRLATDAVRGAAPSVVPSMAKVVATELLQRIAQDATEIAGHAGLVHAPLFTGEVPYGAAGGRFAWEYLERVHATIGAGANDLLRDGIAEAGLGLPRAPRR
jgi:3-oxocholest-4-en-26-oyl-CoA dehydrogenase alpha subunit